MISTGLRGLDEILTGLRTGDNVVWQIDDIKDYKELVRIFVKQALKDKKKVVYMRFAPHEPLLDKSAHITLYKLDAYVGFELFASRVNEIITKEGEGVYYVFDCLSALLSAWATDLMIGNFFMVTCPYLFELNTIAYFSILRNRHSFRSIARIRETTQLLLDVYNFENSFYVHPLKVWNRYSPTMFLPHVKQGDKFIPLTDSINAAKILSYISDKGAESAKRNLDYWDRLFLEAEEMTASGGGKAGRKKMVDKLCSVMLSRNRDILSLAVNNFSLEELIDIKSRMIGTGFIGGKTVGMLLARKLLSEDKALDWEDLSEQHDSFYVGSDFFYSYIIQNHLWKLRMQQKTEESYFKAATVIKEKMLYGSFPEEIMEQFQQIIEYFGVSPIIVRSSSLLEDGFGNAFAGKYESIFLANQGTPEERYLKFADAVRRIYASTMNEDALVYRKQRGLANADEQMSLLVQRVSGSYHKNYFFPDIGGVGVSYNTYVWTDKIDPEAGMLRLVFGLGTRAVNRVEGDYPRIVALDEPLVKPYAEMKDIRKFSQHEVDVINIKDNELQTVSFSGLTEQLPDIKIDRISRIDTEAVDMMAEKGIIGKKYRILTFDDLVSDEAFTKPIKSILKILEKRYKYPVEIEFTINFTKKVGFKINLLQCRPIQTKGLGRKAEIPKDISSNKIFFSSPGYFIGGNVSQAIKRIIYITPKGYIDLSLTGKYDIARIIGKLNRDIESKDRLPTLLLGPGRWGTTTPSLGVPVNFSEINNITVLGEMAFEGSNLMPEVSFGTHFFQDLVETDIFYIALFPNKDNVIFNIDWLKSMENEFKNIIPEYAKYEDIIGVYNVSDRDLKIVSDILSQKVICFADR